MALPACKTDGSQILLLKTLEVFLEFIMCPDKLLNLRVSFCKDSRPAMAIVPLSGDSPAMAPGSLQKFSCLELGLGVCDPGDVSWVRGGTVPGRTHQGSPDLRAGKPGTPRNLPFTLIQGVRDISLSSSTEERMA